MCDMRIVPCDSRGTRRRRQTGGGWVACELLGLDSSRANDRRLSLRVVGDELAKACSEFVNISAPGAAKQP
jgi:hypothetical protein